MHSWRVPNQKVDSVQEVSIFGRVEEVQGRVATHVHVLEEVPRVDQLMLNHSTRT